ncbi:hypothetical protein DSO57_1001668 [Entomophthora muscae]|uniref:Uncharacterized protein n=1 Tax=Entomophthora muscae TaxID=34485 RepID=A0ACC2TXH3_9FUNG|nr:hypothetical protein DSO57_1001668 [Entomophthora muscae]
MKPTVTLPMPLEKKFTERDKVFLASEQLNCVLSLKTKFKVFKAIFDGKVQDCFLFKQNLLKNLKSKKKLFENFLHDACLKPEHTEFGFEAIQEDSYVNKHSAILKGYFEYFKMQ